MTAAGLGTAAAALLAGCGSSSRTVAIPTPTPTPGTTTFDPTNFPGIVGRSEDEVVLNYALTLETLEADLYRQALNIASGRSITDALDATVPASGSTGGYTQKVGNGSISSTFAFPAFLYLVQYAYVEAAHRDFLKTVLGSIGAPVAAANPKGYTAPFGSDLGSIMTLIQAVEEEGTRAYLGAAGKISNVVYLTAAAAIYSTECRHASAVAYILGKDSGPLYNAGDYNVINNTQTTNPVGSVNTFQYYRLPTQVLADVKPFFVS
jgi:hypothetical protein